MFKKIMGVVLVGACALAIAGCSSTSVKYDTPTPTGDESTWLDYTQSATSYENIEALKSAGVLDIVSLADDAFASDVNNVRQNTTVTTDDSSWLGTAKLNKIQVHDVTSDDGLQTLELYYEENHYFKVDISLDTTESAKTVAQNIISAAGLKDQFGENDEDTYDLATTDLDDELEIGDVTNYDVDHYMAVGKCTVNGQQGYWFVKVIGGWARVYICPLNSGFVVSTNVQEYDTIITSYEDLEKNLLRLDENWTFTK